MIHKNQPKQEYPLSEGEFRSIYSRVPRATVEVLVLHEGGVYLTKRGERSWNGMWHIPGGTVYYGETLEQAVHRVARDELQVEVEIEELVGHIYYPSEEQIRGFGWTIGTAFTCSTTDTPPLKNSAGEEISLFTLPPKNLIEEQFEIVRHIIGK